jgi:hypothetical protein
MSTQFPPRLQATTATGAPVLEVVDASSGGLLVGGTEPFVVGTVVHVRLTRLDHDLDGTFAFRCVHVHRTTASDQRDRFISALVFVHEPDRRTREALMRLEAAARTASAGERRPRLLRLEPDPAG